MDKSDLRLKELCQEKGKTLKQLADYLGIRNDSLSQAIGRNNFDMERLRKFSTFFGVPIYELFEHDETNTITCPHCGKKIVYSKKEE